MSFVSRRQDDGLTPDQTTNSCFESAHDLRHQTGNVARRAWVLNAFAASVVKLYAAAIVAGIGAGARAKPVLGEIPEASASYDSLKKTP